jgi:hypothetical protein
MAQTDYSSQLGIDPKDLVSAGQKALQSGQVTPQQAMDSYSWLQSVAPNDKLTNMSSMSSQPNQPPNIMAMGTDGTQPAPAATPAPPTRLPFGMPPQIKKSTTSTNSQDSKSDVKQSTYLDNETLQGLSKQVDKLPDFVQQKSSLSDLQNQLSQIQAMPSNNASWIKPLLAYGDSINGTKTADNYTPAGMSQQDKNALLLKYQNDITQRQNDMTKAKLEAITKLKNGTTDNGTNNKGVTINLDSSQTPSAKELNQSDSGTLRTARMLGSDKLITGLQSNINSLDNSTQMLAKSPTLTVNNFNAAMQDYIGSLKAGMGATEGAMSREMPESLAQAVNKAQNYFSSGGTDLRATTEGRQLVNNLLAQIDLVKTDYARQTHARMTTLGQPLANNLHNQGAVNVANDMMNSYKDPDAPGASIQHTTPVTGAPANIASLKASVPQGDVLVQRTSDGQYGHMSPAKLATKTGYTEVK